MGNKQNIRKKSEELKAVTYTSEESIHLEFSDKRKNKEFEIPTKKYSREDRFVKVEESMTLSDKHLNTMLLLKNTITIKTNPSPKKGDNYILRAKDSNIRTLDFNGKTVEHKSALAPYTMASIHDTLSLTYDGEVWLATGDLI